MEPMTATDPNRTPPGLLLTLSGRDALQRELDDLRAERERQMSMRLREARDAGAEAPMDELWSMQEDEALYDARIARLEEVLRRARITEDGAVAIGSIVTVSDETGRETEYRIVGSHQTSGRGVVSAGSPVGQALLGEKAGAAVDVELPGGRVRTLRIVAVADAAPDSATAAA